MTQSSPYRDEFESALRVLGRISAAMDEAGYRPPVLVVGAAVEIYTTGAITTGDFDMACGRQDILEAVMQRHGFVRPSGAGVAKRGWVHPGLRLGFEVVSDTLLDGMADRAMIRVIELGEDGSVAGTRARGHHRRSHGPVCLAQRARDAGAGPRAQPAGR